MTDDALERTRFRRVEILAVVIIAVILLFTLLPAIESARESSRRIACRTNLRQIMQAAQSFENVNRFLPPGILAADGNLRKAKHSGLAFLLVHLDSQLEAASYDLLRSDWQSERNRSAIGKSVPVFLCPSSDSKLAHYGNFPGAVTDYALCKGSLAYLADKSTGGGLFDVNSSYHSRDVTDGLAKTFAVGEAASTTSQRVKTRGLTGVVGTGIGQIWAKASFDGDGPCHGGCGSTLAVTAENPGPDGKWDTPDDVLAPLNAAEVWVSADASVGSDRQNLNDRVRNFYALHPRGAQFAMADGSVEFISEDIDPRVYRTLSTIAETTAE